MGPSSPVGAYIVEMIERLKEPMNLTGWTLKPKAGPLVDATACCEAWPEYKVAHLSFDIDKLQTGDELDEIIVHEMSHCHTWPIHELGENLATSLAECAPKQHRPSLRKLLMEQVRKAGEDTNVQVGFMVIKLWRRLTVAQRALDEALAEVKRLKKDNRQMEKSFRELAEIEGIK